MYLVSMTTSERAGRKSVEIDSPSSGELKHYSFSGSDWTAALIFLVSMTFDPSDPDGSNRPERRVKRLLSLTLISTMATAGDAASSLKLSGADEIGGKRSRRASVPAVSRQAAVSRGLSLAD